MAKEKKSFNDLNRAELVAAAEFYGSTTEGTVAELRAALAEDGVEWKLYEKDFGLVDQSTVNVIKSNDVAPTREVTEVTVPVVEEVVVTEETNPVLPQGDKFLVKMNRDNPYFEFGNYKFSAEKPFQIMTAEDAERILTQEEGFAQATPFEYREFFK